MTNEFIRNPEVWKDGKVPEELTAQQDDMINDERQFDKDEERHDRADSYYEDWLGDNIAELRKEFCEENEQAFTNYCKIAFAEHKESLI
jgi:hypothetical protein